MKILKNLQYKKYAAWMVLIAISTNNHPLLHAEQLNIESCEQQQDQDLAKIVATNTAIMLDLISALSESLNKWINIALEEDVDGIPSQEFLLSNLKILQVERIMIVKIMPAIKACLNHSILLHTKFALDQEQTNIDNLRSLASAFDKNLVDIYDVLDRMEQFLDKLLHYGFIDFVREQNTVLKEKKELNYMLNSIFDNLDCMLQLSKNCL